MFWSGLAALQTQERAGVRGKSDTVARGVRDDCLMRPKVPDIDLARNAEILCRHGHRLRRIGAIEEANRDIAPMQSLRPYLGVAVLFDPMALDTITVLIDRDCFLVGEDGEGGRGHVREVVTG